MLSFKVIQVLIVLHFWQIKVLRRGRRHVVEAVHIEEFSAAEAREVSESISYALMQVNMSSLTLHIQQKGSMSNLLGYSGVELLFPLLLTISKHYSNENYKLYIS